MDPEVDDDDERWRTEFYRQLEMATSAMAPQFRAKALGGLSQETYDKAVVALNSARGLAADGVTPQFKHWAKNKFVLATKGEEQVLHGIMDGKPVITYEKIFDVVKACHLAVGHQGIKKTRLETVNNYSGIGLPMKAVEICVALCACAKSKLKKVLPPMAPGKATFLTRVQVDLIDMRSQPDGALKWILHLRDHFTKFCWSFPMTDNQGAEAASHIAHVFAMFGAARVLQTHLGKKFASQLAHSLTDTWPELIVVNRRPRNQPSKSSSNSDARGGTAELEASLSRWKVDTQCADWSRALLHCVHALNASWSTTSAGRSSPYESVFGRPPLLEQRLPQSDRQPGLSDYLDDVDSEDVIYSQGGCTKRAKKREFEEQSRRDDLNPMDVAAEVLRSDDVDDSGADACGVGVSSVELEPDADFLMVMRNGSANQLVMAVEDKVDLTSQQQEHQNSPGSTSVCEFTALEELGRGSYGTVYKVEDRQVCGLTKALKVLDFALGPYESIMFKRVGETLVTLFHENTVRVHRVLFLDGPYGPQFCLPASCRVPTPAVALVTELCDDSLQARLRRRPAVEPGWNLYVFRQIMQGLQFLHSNGLVHRDLRPANCLIKGDRIKLCDFGLAGLSAFNVPGLLASAAGYLAPEVGAGEPFDDRADVYSLGVILAELYSWGDAFVAWLQAGAGRYRTELPPEHQVPNYLAAFAMHMMREAHFRPSLVTLITNI